MILLIGIALLIATPAILVFAFISAARLDDKPLSLSILSSKRCWEIYIYGSYYVTGKPISPRYGLSLVFFTFILFPASYSIDARFEGGLATLPYLIVARLLSLFGPLCGWPGIVYFYDSALFAMQKKTYARVPFFLLAGLLTLGMFCFHLAPLIGFWPPFRIDYLML